MDYETENQTTKSALEVERPKKNYLLPASILISSIIFTGSCAVHNTDLKADDLCQPFVFAAHPQGHPLRMIDGEIFKSNDPSVIFDKEEGVFKMWDTYWREREQRLGISYATSKDGILWDLPKEKGERIHVLSPSENSWDKRLETVSVVKFKDGYEYNGEKWQYLIWYMGYPGVDEDGKTVFKGPGRRKAIGLAFSKDGVHWVKYDDNPVLYPEEEWEQNFWQPAIEGGKEFLWSDGGVQEPTVLWNEEEKKFGMWYQGHSGWGMRTEQIGYAESKDGIHWNKYSENPVFPAMSRGHDVPPYGSPHVISDEQGGYFMFYHSFGYRTSIGMACSQDGIHWNDPYIPIIESNLSKEWVQKWSEIYPGTRLVTEGPVPHDAVIYVGASPLIFQKNGRKELRVYVSCTEPGNISFSRTTYMCLFTAPLDEKLMKK